jgi:hypothetical protein
VRDAAREPPDRFHLLRLAQLRFAEAQRVLDAAPFGEIADPRGEERAPARLDARDRELHGNPPIAGPIASSSTRWPIALEKSPSGGAIISASLRPCASVRASPNIRSAAAFISTIVPSVVIVTIASNAQSSTESRFHLPIVTSNRERLQPSRSVFTASMRAARRPDDSDAASTTADTAASGDGMLAGL